MTSNRRARGRNTLACGVAVAALLAAAPVLAQPARALSFPAEPMDAALRDLARKSGVDILFSRAAVAGLRSAPVQGAASARDAAQAMTANTNLEVVTGAGGALVVRTRGEGASPQSVTPANLAAQAEPSETAQVVAELIVTANKREERLLSVPAAISALSGASLRRNQAHRFEDYLTTVPGLNYVSSGEGTTQLILRGITSGTTQVSSTVGIYVDEAPFGSSTVFAGGAFGTPDFDTSDIARIEVLKGPQGTLYGANALGGVLKFVTTAPDAGRYGGHVEVGAASVDGGGEGYNASAAVNLPLVRDQLALRVSAFARKDPGYIDDPSRGRTDINSATVKGARAALLWKPRDDLTVNLSAFGQNLDAKNPSSEDVTVPGFDPVKGDRQQSRLFDGPKTFRYRAYNGVVTWNLDWASLVSATGYSTFRSNPVSDVTTVLGAPFPIQAVQPVHEAKWTQELRLQSPTSDMLEWRAGVFFTHEQSHQEQHLRTLNPATGVVAPLPLADAIVPSRYTEYAGFGDLTYHFTPRFDVTVGARYSHNRQHFGETFSGLLVPVPADFTRITSDSSWTWLINPRFKLDEQQMVYGRIATGYRAGGPTLAVPNQPSPKEFDPDTVTNYEFGYKATLLDRRLTLDADVFYIDWRDIQLNESINGFSYITNGGKARSKGAEAAATLTPMSGLTLNGSLTYTEAKLTQDAPGAGGFKGDRLPGVPRWNAALDAAYDWTLTEGWGAFVGASYRYVGKRPTNFQTLGGSGLAGPRFTVDSYGVVDLRAGATHGGWTLSAYAKNVGDERGIVAVGPNSPDLLHGTYAAGIIQPRTYGVDLSASF
ncbi:MAG: TonB-dependent receptor [Caulobacterales bacterium]|nr:TonB-dependent receptor [Caulobacterales bacterium]